MPHLNRTLLAQVVCALALFCSPTSGWAQEVVTPESPIILAQSPPDELAPPPPPPEPDAFDAPAEPEPTPKPAPRAAPSPLEEDASAPTSSWRPVNVGDVALMSAASLGGILLGGAVSSLGSALVPFDAPEGLFVATQLLAMSSVVLGATVPPWLVGKARGLEGTYWGSLLSGGTGLAIGGLSALVGVVIVLDSALSGGGGGNNVPAIIPFGLILSAPLYPVAGSVLGVVLTHNLERPARRLELSFGAAPTRGGAVMGFGFRF